MIAVGTDAEAAGDVVSAKKYFEYAIRDCPDSPAISGIKTSIETMERNGSYVQGLNVRKRTETEELSKREKFERAFTDIAGKRKNADSVITWWKNEIHLLNIMIEGKKRADADMASRLFNMITGTCIEYGREMLSTGNYHAAAVFFTIWTISEPEKKYSWYNLARACALNGQTDRAIAALRMSVDKGFDDKKYIANDPAFKSMLKDEHFINLMNDGK
jgi:tetratricopeptide (TPR) repeat protein